MTEPIHHENSGVNEMQALLSYWVSLVAPNPLMLHKSQYEHLDALGLDMTGCEVVWSQGIKE